MNLHAVDPKRRVLKDVFGFDEFRPGQEVAMDALLNGRNILTVMPTGSGKSLCFQVPALVLGGLTVVVSPLVALMQDQVAALHLAGVAADSINSSQSREDNIAAWRRAAAGETRLLYLAPERLMAERMLTALPKLDIRLIAIDEAHCISQWGPAFRPEYEMLSRLREHLPGVPVAALTATADEVTRADILAKLFDGDAETIVLGFDRPNIRLTVEPKHEPKKQLLNFLSRHKGKSGIVYCLSRKKTDETAEFLIGHGVNALPYHAGMDKELREQNQNRFMTESAIVMVATIAFGMGIDKSDVRFVFHADLPGSVEAYYQEIGRAGRDGTDAEAHMLFGMGDIRMRRMFIEDENAGEDRKRREHQRLNALIGYCEAASCRRQVLLGYFGEFATPCGNCDLCLSPTALVDGTEIARLILSAIRQTGERYGTGHIVDILRGQKNDKVAAAHHDRLPTFGKAENRKRDELQTLVRQLIAGNYLHLDVAGYGGLSLTIKGTGLLNGEEVFHHRPHTPRATKRSMREAAAAELSTGDTSLLAALKDLRLKLAKQRRVPAYVIFSDKTLLDMAQRRPQTEDEFAEVNGVGASKLREFGMVFLAAIRAAANG
ncbi:MAG: DNA helicase RecQ [Alphaproteobacteria bacterium]|nr:DNA helicase RecQ [Alphaproteobacteria bacterium]MBV9904183.1 DNA helicase RecQ [Alphaproteobacteria bacterium]